MNDKSRILLEVSRAFTKVYGEDCTNPKVLEVFAKVNKILNQL